MDKEILRLNSEIETWKFLADTLTQEHQQNVKMQIIKTIKIKEFELRELRKKFEEETK